MEKWSSGTVEKWSSGTVEKWNSGTMKKWNSGTVEKWSRGTVEKWSSTVSQRHGHFVAIVVSVTPPPNADSDTNIEQSVFYPIVREYSVFSPRPFNLSCFIVRQNYCLCCIILYAVEQHPSDSSRPWARPQRHVAVLYMHVALHSPSTSQSRPST